MAFWRWIWPASKKPQDCPFCLLSAGSTEGRTPSILFQDEQIVVFKDRSPASYRHYLAVPVHHIKNIQSLHQSEADYDLVAHMHKVGQSLLLRDAPDATGYRLLFTYLHPPLGADEVTGQSRQSVTAFHAEGLGSTGHHSTVLTICIYIVWLSLTYHGGKVSSMHQWVAWGVMSVLRLF